MSRRHYRGRRQRGGGGSGFLFFVLLLIAAVVVFAVIRGGRKSPDPENTDTEQNDPADPQHGENDPDGGDSHTEEGGDEPDNGQTAEVYERIELQGDQQQYNAVYRVGDTGYEMYTYSSDVAGRYAEAVTATADALKGTAAVYSLAVPLSSGITLPDDLMGEAVFGDQKSAEENIGGMMGENVRFVPLYHTLMCHRTEYIYYRTDHHWTGLGAYYAYRQFCQAKGITPHALTDYEARDFTGFLGSFYNDSGSYPGMKDNPDTVTAYYPIAEAPMFITDQKSNTVKYPNAICDESNAPAAYKYGAYIYGDNTFTELQNQSLSDGSACLVVKESFGNAFVPFLVDHYQTVYVVDYRYWSGNLADFVRKNGVQVVLFINNLSAIRSSYLIGKLQGIL